MVTDKMLRASAKRIRPSQAGETIAVSLTVTCEECGERFGIAHGLEAEELARATRHAKWLTEQFTWDHIQENKHKGSITLPAL